MPRIEQRVIGTSLFMYVSADAADAGSRSGGSGVLIGQPAETLPGTVHLYAVTNTHVVECAGAVVPRIRTRSGDPKRFDLGLVDWEPHPGGEDVSIAWLEAVPASGDRELQWVPRDWLITKADLGIVAARTGWPWETGPIVAGEDTFSIARFVGYDGVDRNQPTVRFGNLSSPEAIDISQRPGRDRDQQSLLVEARSLAGYSGAPVFVYRTSGYFAGGVAPVDEALLLGIGWGHIKHPEDEKREYDVEMESPDRPTPGRYNSGIMAVVPSWMIAELLDHPKVVAMRREYEEDANNETGVELDVADDEFERFDESTTTLLGVSKKELDEKRETT
jgi:hypothetical protein